MSLFGAAHYFGRIEIALKHSNGRLLLYFRFILIDPCFCLFKSFKSSLATSYSTVVLILVNLCGIHCEHRSFTVKRLGKIEFIWLDIFKYNSSGRTTFNSSLRIQRLNTSNQRRTVASSIDSSPNAKNKRSRHHGSKNSTNNFLSNNLLTCLYHNKVGCLKN